MSRDINLAKVDKKILQNIKNTYDPLPTTSLYYDDRYFDDINYLIQEATTLKDYIKEEDEDYVMNPDDMNDWDGIFKQKEYYEKTITDVLILVNKLTYTKFKNRDKNIYEKVCCQDTEEDRIEYFKELKEMTLDILKEIKKGYTICYIM